MFTPSFLVVSCAYSRSVNKRFWCIWICWAFIAGSPWETYENTDSSGIVARTISGGARRECHSWSELSPQQVPFFPFSCADFELCEVPGLTHFWWVASLFWSLLPLFASFHFYPCLNCMQAVQTWLKKHICWLNPMLITYSSHMESDRVICKSCRNLWKPHMIPKWKSKCQILYCCLLIWSLLQDSTGAACEAVTSAAGKWRKACSAVALFGEFVGSFG